MSRPHSTPHVATRADWAALGSLLPYLWEYRTRVLIAFSCLVCAKVANVAVPIVLKGIIDALDMSRQHVLELPLTLLLGYGALRLATVLFGELRDLVFAKVAQRSIRRIARKVFRHLHALALSFHLDRQTGGVSRDIERGSRGISFLLTFTLFNVLPTLVEILLIAGVLLTKYDPWFAVITFTTVTIYIVLTLVVTEWRLKYRRTMNELDSKANTHAIDSLLNYETVKYFGNENYESQRYDSSLADWEKAAIKSQTTLSALNFAQGTVIATGATILMVLASQGVVAGTLTLGDLVLINAFLIQLFIPMNFLGFVYREIKNSLTDMEKMFSLLRVQPDVRDRPGASELDVGNGEVRFENVFFAYRPDRPILKNTSFTIPPGRKVAVVGHSGAGKSTLVRLLFRFYDVTGGRIIINGQDIRDVTQQSLRAAIGIVPQDTVLFNDTIYYNIVYAMPNASAEQVVLAAKLAHIHAFIQSLPEGYETRVGERGLKLSGGEKQRIAIARTILKNPKILVFDEATSALDSRSELTILRALREVAANHTTLVIAHRLSTVVDADEILVMEDGVIVERGTHRNLLAGAPLYSRMWELQQQERGSEAATITRDAAPKHP